MSRVEIYTTGYCPYCHRAKAILEEYGVDFEEYDVTIDPDGRRAMTERAEGRRTVPQIFIDGRGIGGCDELTELARTGKLDGMLAG
ncbi:MAG: glutaredoxin 3 [Pseudomonadota bacterium]